MNKLAAAVMAVFLAGCGSGAISQVSGKVTFNDGKALSKGVVTYTGDKGTYSGAIGPEGVYTLEEVMPGEYDVVITGAQEGGGTPEMKYDEQGNYIPQPETPVTKLVDPKYEDPETSGLKKTVPGSDYDLKVEAP